MATIEPQIMIDLETVGVESLAAIASIGAVVFNESGVIESDSFYKTVELQSVVNIGMEIEPGAMLWWMKQNESVRKATFEHNPENIEQVLNAFSTWVSEIQSKYNNGQPMNIWARGASFDFTILKNAYKLMGKTEPWKFWKERCFRTLADQYPELDVKPPETSAHCALTDAHYQACGAIKMLLAQSKVSEQAKLKERLDQSLMLIDLMCNGIEWHIDTHSEIITEADYEMLDEANLFLHNNGYKRIVSNESK